MLLNEKGQKVGPLAFDEEGNPLGLPIDPDTGEPFAPFVLDEIGQPIFPRWFDETGQPVGIDLGQDEEEGDADEE